MIAVSRHTAAIVVAIITFVYASTIFADKVSPNMRVAAAIIAHPFIARVLSVFIAISPLALIATAFFGGTLARWASI